MAVSDGFLTIPDVLINLANCHLAKQDYQVSRPALAVSNDELCRALQAATSCPHTASRFLCLALRLRPVLAPQDAVHLYRTALDKLPQKHHALVSYRDREEGRDRDRDRETGYRAQVQLGTRSADPRGRVHSRVCVPACVCVGVCVCAAGVAVPGTCAVRQQPPGRGADGAPPRHTHVPNRLQAAIQLRAHAAGAVDTDHKGRFT